MKNQLTDYEKVMYKFAYECALKGIDMEELQAINKQIEELGWNK